MSRVLLVPVVALTAGLSLLLSGSFFTTLDFQLSTAQFNSRNAFTAEDKARLLLLSWLSLTRQFVIELVDRFTTCNKLAWLKALLVQQILTVIGHV